LVGETNAVREDRYHAEALSIMSDDDLEHVERQISSMRVVGSPAALRGAVLRGVGRELRASRWDRRLARAAVVLLALGVGLNASLGLKSDDAWRVSKSRVAGKRASFVDTAIVLAEATDASTARLFARQMAAMNGRKLTDDETAAIDAAVRRPVIRGPLGNKG
jgi:hypothetical protein